MNGVRFDPYLFFAGNAREAMESYQGIFGGKLDLQTFGEVNPDTPEEQKNKVIHARLEGDINLMASDNMTGSPMATGKISLCLSGDDEDKLRQYFDELSAGGKVNYPLTKEFWGDVFGTLTDKFGVDWMVDIQPKK